jgi:hypothetical protein
VSEYTDPAFLAPLNLDQLRNLLAKVDSTLAEGRELREKIVKAMEERRARPFWPETVRSPDHR